MYFIFRRNQHGTLSNVFVTVYTDVGYSRLNKTGGTSTSGVGKTSRVKKEVVPEPSAVKGLKFGLWFLPRAVRSTTHSFLQDSTSEAAGKGKNKGEIFKCFYSTSLFCHLCFNI